MDLQKVAQIERQLGIGRFQISAMIQKRVQELVRGAPPLVDLKTDRMIDVALEEIYQGRVSWQEGEDESGGDEEAPEEETGTLVGSTI